MKVAVIGSKGYIGKHLMLALDKREGFEANGFSSSDGNSIDPVSGLLCDDFSIPPGTDAVIYLAQSPYYNQLPEMAWHLWNVNVASAIKAAEAARKENVGRFIYASTGNVYAPGFTPLTETSPLRRDNGYALSKIHAEEALSLYKDAFDLTVIRIFGVYGPGQTQKLVPNLYQAIKQNKTIYFGSHPTDKQDNDGLKISLCYIDDMVELIIKLLSKTKIPVINMAGDEVVSLRTIVTRMCEYAGCKLHGELTETPRQCDLVADIALLQSVFKAQFTPLECGLKNTLESFNF